MKKALFIGGVLDGQTGKMPELAPTYKAVRSRPKTATWSSGMVSVPLDIEYDEYRLEIIAQSGLSEWKCYFYVLQGVPMKCVIEQMIAAYLAVSAPAPAACAACGHTAADHPGDGYACGGLRQIAAGVAERCQCAGFAPASAAASEQEPQ